MGKGINGKELGKGIVQRKDTGIYCARYVDRLGNRQSLYSSNLRELKQNLKKALQEDLEKKDLLQNFTLNSWFDFWFDNYKLNKGLSEAYLDNLARYYNNYVRDVGDVDITKFRNMDALKIINEALTVSTTAGGEVRRVLNMMFKAAEDNYIVSRNVIKGIEANRRKKLVKEPLSKKDEKALLEACKLEKHRDIILVGLNTGLRISELLALTFDEVDLENKIITVKHQFSYYKNDEGEYYFTETKTKRERKVPMNDKAYTVLKRNIKERQKFLANDTRRIRRTEITDQLIFLNYRYEPYTRTGFHSNLKNIVENAINNGHKFDCSNVSAHTFRHTFASRCLEAGMSATSVSTLLGHANIRMTIHYVHNTLDQFDKDTQLLNSL